ncbi:MAG TPA: hypothetical protein VFA52_03215 [Candidatus Paceibacterota bacterium]|nr:hypothetical protein [Candidatus Paceibacterota bacterium]
MSKTISIAQSHNLVSILANNTDWKQVDSKVAQDIIDNPRGAGNQFTRFLRNGAKIDFEEPKIIPIDRFEPLNPDNPNWSGDGWSIDEQDERSLALTEIDLNKVRLVTTLKAGEITITGEERLARLKKANYVNLDAQTLFAFLQHTELLPPQWKRQSYRRCFGKIPQGYIFFHGTILRDRRGRRHVPYVNWDGKESWVYIRAMDTGFQLTSVHPSAVLVV